VGSGISGSDTFTSSTSGSQVTVAIPNNAASGGTISLPANLGTANHVMSTGGAFFTASTNSASTSATPKYFSFGASVGGATRANNQWVMPGVSGATGTYTLLNLVLVTGSTQTTGALTCVVEANGTATGLTITVTNGSVAGTFYDNTHTYNGNAADLLDFACTNSSGSGPSVSSIGVQQQ
jgi:hypothetical protein